MYRKSRFSKIFRAFELRFVWVPIFLATVSGCSTAPISQNARSITSLNAQELATIRRDRKDVILVGQNPPPVKGKVIKLVGTDQNGHLQIFLLDLCTGGLYNATGAQVYQYPGEWGGGDC